MVHSLLVPEVCECKLSIASRYGIHLHPLLPVNRGFLQVRQPVFENLHRLQPSNPPAAATARFIGLGTEPTAHSSVTPSLIAGRFFRESVQRLPPDKLTVECANTHATQHLASEVPLIHILPPEAAKASIDATTLAAGIITSGVATFGTDVEAGLMHKPPAERVPRILRGVGSVR